MLKEGDTLDFSPEVTTWENVTPVVTTISTIESSAVTTETVSTRNGAIPRRRTSLTDPRVSWIYDMNKEKLTKEMLRYGLPTFGNVKALRGRFSEFWRNVAAQLAPPGFTTGKPMQPNSWLRDEASGHPAMESHKFVVLQELTNVSLNVRKILGLSPNADSTSVPSALTSMLAATTTNDPSDWSAP